MTELHTDYCRKVRKVMEQMVYIWAAGMIFIDNNKGGMKSQGMQDLIKGQSPFKQLIVFNQRPKNNSRKWTLHFNDQSLTVSQKEEVLISIDYNDMIGIIEQQISQGIFKMKINSFPRRTRCLGSPRRTIQTSTFWLEVQAKQMEEVKSQLVRIITNRPVCQQLRLLVYLNPNAGSNSQKHFDTMEEFLAYTNFTYDVVRTTHRGHCQEHLSTIDTEKYQAVIIISGDGLMHQFVNSEACGKIPVSHVPGGSGNAFSKAQTTLANEECRDQEALYLVVKGKTRTMNLMKVQFENLRDPVYSFLAFQWAFLADIDMNSEFLRCLGGLRFEIYSVYRCLALRRYRGRLAYSTVSTQLPPLNQEITQQSFQRVQTDFLNFVFCVIPFISDKYEFAPLVKVEEEAIDMQFITSENGRWQLIKYLLSSSNGDHFDKEQQRKKEGYEFTHGKIKSFRLQPLGEGDQMGIFGIDGERYDAQRMQASMSDKKVLTFA